MSSHAGSQSPRGSGSGSRRGSQAGSRPGSEAGGSPRKSNPFGSGLGFDPARDPNKREMTEAEIIGKKVDLPPDAYHTGKEVTRFAPRPGHNTDGKPIKVQLNIFQVNRIPRGDIFQYDVSVSPNDRGSRALVKKVWNSKRVQSVLAKVGGKWLCDGNKLAWSSQKLPKGEERINVDLDAEAGKTGAPGRQSMYYCVIRQTKTLHMEYLGAYLQRKVSWDSTVLECMNFLDHVMRQNPSEQLISIKRNFYAPNANRIPLENYLEVIKGTYAAFRLGDSILRGGTGLSVNVDITNTTFWQGRPLAEVALRMTQSFKPEWRTINMGRLQEECRPQMIKKPNGSTDYAPSDAFKVLRRLSKIKFLVNHRGKMGDPKMYTGKSLVWNVAKYGPQGANAKTITFTQKNRETGQSKEISIYDYFYEQYKLRLQFPHLPVLETSKGSFFPLEVCNIASYQRYQFKLDPQQTAAMIKIAVTRPDKRKADIMNGVRDLNWQNDPYLRAFDVPVSSDMVVTNARLLQNPEITYANKKENPGMSGRWDLRGKKFWEANQKPLVSWGMVAIGNSCDKQQLEAFSTNFCNIYRGHGGKVERPPVILNFSNQMDYGTMTENAYNTISSRNKAHAQMVFFVLENKNQLVYERIKKNMDCRWCVVSQCLQGLHVKKNQGQYCSNVAMKVNAKLGGVTCKIAGPTNNPASPPFFKCPTMIIGLDVTHGAPGSGQPSMAAMTISMDKNATRYAGSCEANGWRAEIVGESKMNALLTRLLGHWVSTHGTPPKHVYFFRDGVSEGEFQDIIDEELKALKRCFREKNYPVPKFTVIVATKRHHIRFFPKPGDRGSADRNANPLPGTLVEQDATHPFHWDFYLCSHVAIQGTARPVHYNVICDEFGVDANLLQKMIYQQCYQYCRSTTPVSIHPAIYYSHLASQRARSHENIASSQKEMTPVGKAGFPIGKGGSEVYSGDQRAEPPPLLPMSNKTAFQENVKHINTTMWYV